MSKNLAHTHPELSPPGFEHAAADAEEEASPARQPDLAVGLSMADEGPAHPPAGRTLTEP